MHAGGGELNIEFEVNRVLEIVQGQLCMNVITTTPV